MFMEVNMEKESPEKAKKRKIDDDGDGEKAREESESFNGFKVKAVINENARQKYLFLHCTKNDEDAVVLLEKTPFDSSMTDQILSDNTKIRQTLQNDIYHTYSALLPENLNGVKATVICPASEKHIKKYTEQESFVIQETAELYTKVTLPYLEKNAFSTKWVYNILEKKKEADRIVFENADPDTGFILLPDMKWDGKDLNSLYLQAIVHKHGLKSVRDLNKSHLPLLNNILEEGADVINQEYGIPKSKLRIYIHYQPSYYHLHVHFNHINLESPGFDADRAHLLVDVIENIEMNDSYYQDKTLVYRVREQDELYKLYQDEGYFVDFPINTSISSNSSLTAAS
ncbi:m7GpppX diphosphatase-like [Mytilus edulis]|uniref:m7GpppX diphosphatase-like n=1 Tax=Mytilus edulis TaxID=6550 RepID=UPI0039F11233